jgi:endonuclease G
VAIPNYYYKALLQRRGTGASSSYQAMAIWVPHKAATGNATKSDLITIDRLEELTGIDFFHNLDDTTEQSVESYYDLLYWSGIN